MLRLNQLRNKIRVIFKERIYLAIFIVLLILFSIFYIFEWNFVLWSNFYIRSDLFTFFNIIVFFITSILSSTVLTLGIYNLRNRCSGKGSIAIVPTFFTSMCSGCPPLILSFFSATTAFGLSLSRFNTYLNIIIILLLMTSLLFLSSTRCSTRRT